MNTRNMRMKKYTISRLPANNMRIEWKWRKGKLHTDGGVLCSRVGDHDGDHHPRQNVHGNGP